MSFEEIAGRSEEAIAAYLRQWLLQTFMKGARAGAVRDQTALLGGDLLDSIGMMELVVHLEERWGVTIAAEEVTPGNFGSVEALARFVAKKTDGP